MSNIDWRFWKQQVIKGFVPQSLYERAERKAKRKKKEKDLLAVCEAIKLRIAFIGLPSEPMNKNGPDWSKEIALFEDALAQ